MTGGTLIGKLIRFALVGGTASLIYAACTYSLIAWAVMPNVTASVVAYAIAIPFSFLGQKYYTFKSTGRATIELPLFTITHVIGLALSTAIMAIFAALALNPALGILTVIFAIPVFSFVLMSYVVFPSRTGAT